MSKTVIDEYLVHHGILGQKWGRRNGPPYPLNPANRSSDEKKQNGSKYTESGLAAYKNAKLALGGGGGGGNDDDEEDKKKREELIKKIAELTGMKESEIRNLLALREKTDGKNDKYLSDLKSISEGDPQMAKRIDNAISSYMQEKNNKQKVSDLRVPNTNFVYQIEKKDVGSKIKDAYNAAKNKADKVVDDVKSKAQDVVDMYTYPNGKNKLSRYEEKEFEKAKAALKAKDIDEKIRAAQKEANAKAKEETQKARAEANTQQQKLEQEKRLKQKVNQAVLDSYTKTNPNNPNSEEAKKLLNAVKDEFVKEWNREDSNPTDSSSSNNASSNDVISKLENSQFRKAVDSVKKTDAYKKFEDAKYVFSKKIERSDTYQEISDALEALGIKAPTSDLEKAVKRSEQYQNAEDLAYVLGKIGERSDSPQELLDNLHYYGLDIENLKKQVGENLVTHSSRYELYHHGILGQKWGKRNGPPYPLSRNPFKRAAIYGSKKINSGLEKISRIPQHMLEKPAAKWKDRGDKYATRKKVAEEYLNGKKSDNPKSTNNAENTYIQINDSNTGKTFTKPISSMTSNELRSTIEHIKLQNELVSLLNGNSNSSNSNNYNSPPISTGREYLNDLNRDIGNYVKVGRDIVGLVGSIYDTRQKLRGKGDSKAEKALKDIDRITEDLKK